MRELFCRQKLCDNNCDFLYVYMMKTFIYLLVGLFILFQSVNNHAIKPPKIFKNETITSVEIKCRNLFLVYFLTKLSGIRVHLLVGVSDGTVQVCYALRERNFGNS